MGGVPYPRLALLFGIVITAPSVEIIRMIVLARLMLMAAGDAELAEDQVSVRGFRQLLRGLDRPHNYGLTRAASSVSAKVR